VKRRSQFLPAASASHGMKTVSGSSGEPRSPSLSVAPPDDPVP
jgi:hypothetical protein